jgi:TPR repeat protein
MKTAWVALLAFAPAAYADNLIKDFSRTPREQVEAACGLKDWVACRELGDRAHYGKEVKQDFAAAKRFYEQAGFYGDSTANGDLKTLALDVRCASLGAKVLEPGTIKDVEDCAVDYYAAKAEGKGDFKETVECAKRVQQAETLAMLYANGQGVPRDLDRAIRAACEYRDVSAERDGLLEAVFALKDDVSDEPVDFCKYVTSGYNSFRCATYTSGATGAEDDARLEKARAGWTPAAVAAWQAVAPVAEKFVDEEATAQTYGSRLGTGHNAMWEEAQTDLNHELAELALAAAAFDPSKAGPLADADRELNAVYGQYLAQAEDDGEKQAIRAAERAWIPYRDALVAFYSAMLAGRYPPSVIAEGARARVTRDRAEQIKKVVR